MKTFKFLVIMLAIAGLLVTGVVGQNTTTTPKAKTITKSTTTKATTTTKAKETQAPAAATPGEKKEEIQWLSYDVGVPKAKAENKHVVIDFTTSWCGWCKKMEAETFTDPEVIKLMNDNFVPVRVIGDSEHKLDIEGYKISEEDLTTKTFGVRGFPCFAFLTPQGQSLGTVPGYRPKEQFVELLTYVKDKKYVEEMKQREAEQQKQQQSPDSQTQSPGNN